MRTRTGQFPIGFRVGRAEWQKRGVRTLVPWAKETGFDAIDLMRATTDELVTVKQLDFRVGSVDLIDFHRLLVPDATQRGELIAQNVAYIRECALQGVRTFFTCLVADPSRKRTENYGTALEALAPLAFAAKEVNATIAIEGAPGAAPHFANLACTPESCRSLLRDLGSKGVGINYDPSHLIRLGVDHIRFLKEFGPHVVHVHAKDTELMPEAAYEFGLYQGSIFARPHGWGEHVWRYTIPGAGCARFTEIFRILSSIGYKGIVSVELEDENFCGSEESEKIALQTSLAFLRGA